MSTAERQRRLANLEANRPVEPRPDLQLAAAYAWLLGEHRATHPELVTAIESASAADRPVAVVDLLEAAGPGTARQFFAYYRGT